VLRILGAIAICALIVAPSARSARAEEVDETPARRGFFIPDLPAAGRSLAERQYLTGDWGGLRSRLHELGITPTLTFVTDVQGNPVGGLQQRLRETDDLGLDITANLERLVGWPGGLFGVSFSMRSGTNLSADVGNVFTVAQACCGHTYRLVDVYLEQSLNDHAVNIRVGRIAAGDDFLTSPLYLAFVQGAINGNPSGISFNVPVTAYPVATWGARVRVKPAESLYVMAGAYNGDPSLGENAKHGVDWSMRGPLFTIGEVGYRHNQRRGATGLPGNYKLGGFYSTGSFPDLFRDVQGGSAALSGLPPEIHQGNWGFYLLLDQKVYEDGGIGSARGLTPFVSLLFSPDQHINQLPFFANGGLVYQGPFPARPHDRAALGVVYGAFSEELRRSQRDARSVGTGGGLQTYELVLELTYMFQATRWLQVQPDVQYVINPGGTGKIRNALVIGFQLALNL
jgi:porin